MKDFFEGWAGEKPRYEFPVADKPLRGWNCLCGCEIEATRFSPRWIFSYHVIITDWKCTPQKN